MLASFFPRAARTLLSVFFTFSIAAPVSLLIAEPAFATTHHHHGKKTAATQTATKAKARAGTTGKAQHVASRAKTNRQAAATTHHRHHHLARHAAVAAPIVAGVPHPYGESAVQAADPVTTSFMSAAEAAAQARRHSPTSIENPAHIPLSVASRAALVIDAKTGEVLYGKNNNQTMPIASITKLMTAMIVLDAGLNLNEPITITEDDADHFRHTSSRLTVGTTLSRGDAMLIALMASENRAANALARTYPGGFQAAIAAMNRKARSLGMDHTSFVDANGLHGNASTPGDLAKMVLAASRYPEIRNYSTTAQYTIMSRGRPLEYRNTNSLVKRSDWDIEVTKTGFVNESGHCLVMMARVNQTPVIMVLMDSDGKYTRIGDASRVKRWLEVALRS